MVRNLLPFLQSTAPPTLREPLMMSRPRPVAKKTVAMRSLLLGTGLTLASLIFIPALAQRWGIGAGLTGALRVAAMRASQKV